MATPPPKTGRWSRRHNRLAVAAGYESWDDWCESLEAEKDRPICGAMNRQCGPCRNHAAENGRCNARHGGKSPKGIAHPSFEHGRFSKFTPRGWRGAYEENLANRDALDLLYDLAALGVAELQEKLTGLVDGVMERARAANRDMHVERGVDDGRFVEAWARLDLALDDSVTHLEVREGLHASSESLRKLADTIRKTETDQFDMVRADRLEMLELFIVDIIRRAAIECIADPKIRTMLLGTIADQLDTQASAQHGRVLEIPPPKAEVA